MKLATVTCIAVSALALVAAVGAGGCEAIVTNDVPAYNCSMTPFLDAGTGSCPQGMFCEGAGCVKCNPKGNDPCDGYDNDCDGVIDDGPKSDKDNDGFTYCGTVNPATGEQYKIDCNDNDPKISPAGHEVCNGKDDNCDGIIDNPNLVCPAGETCVPATEQCISNAATCNASNCPSPKVCDPTTQQCVVAASQDAGTTGCTSNVQCTTGICATATELGASQSSVCTQACCTSADCASLNTAAASYVCYGAGTGGNYCVSATSLGRAGLGAGLPGTTCSRGPDCASGVCTASLCEDTCCSDGDCGGSGAACTVTTFSGQTTFACIAPAGNAAPNKTCKNNSDCESGYCAGYQATNEFTGETENVYACAPPCCSSKACGQLEGNQLICNDDFYPPPTPGGATPTSGPVVPVCDDVQEDPGTSDESPKGQVGDPCTTTTDCYSNQCLIFASGSFCSDVCCKDSDCATTGWVCRPTPVGSGTFLRCIPQPTTAD